MASFRSTPGGSVSFLTADAKRSDEKSNDAARQACLLLAATVSAAAPASSAVASPEPTLPPRPECHAALLSGGLFLPEWLRSLAAADLPQLHSRAPSLQFPKWSLRLGVSNTKNGLRRDKCVRVCVCARVCVCLHAYVCELTRWYIRQK